MNIIKTKAIVLTLAAGLMMPALKAQDSKDKVQKDQTIVIRKKGDSKEKIKVEVDGENVTVNGKPLSEYKGDDIEVIKGNRLWNMDGRMALTLPKTPRGAVAPRIQSLPRMNMAPLERMEGFEFPGEKRAFLGVTTEKAEGGAKITEISKGSAAEKAGLKKDDIITKIGSAKIESSEDLYEAVSKYKPEEKVTISYKRDGREATVNAVLGSNNSFSFDNLHMTPSLDLNNDFNGNFNNNFVFRGRPRLGMQVQETDNSAGIKVLDVDENSAADKAGIKENDIITSVNGKEVNKLEDIRELVRDIKEGDALKITYKRDNKTENTEIKFPKKLKKADL
ncbi:MAG: hypothetical protein JWN76_89 [Chitinophagaceae bacterium]|nr:hypothetical protein [Chitinophagaceae bacterium]